MAKLSLKTLLGKRNEAALMLAPLIDAIGTDAGIYDEVGSLLAGKENDEYKISHTIQLGDEILGFVKGDEKCIVIVNLLNYLLQKESEKKRLGLEVLNLYQEVNLIFNFSERLSQTIDASSICAIALDEASHVIKSGAGAVVLWDEHTKSLELPASFGDSFIKKEKINDKLSHLLQIVLNGQSEILTNTSALIEAGVIGSAIKSIIYSSLKVKHRVMGVILLASDELVQYTAGDLKLLTTLALQSSAAIESSLLFEKNIRESREREEAMRLVNEITGKFVPYEFIGALGHKLLTDVKLGDQVEKVVTVLFSDIRDFTTISEQMTPDENFRFVCSFNERMGPVIRKNNGFINQYLGDAIMAIFPGSAFDALSAAIEMQQEVAKLNMIRQINSQPIIQIGVGMHTGPLIMGITGDADRMDATTISDTVNTASRLESLTKNFKANIILSDASLKQIANKEDFRLRYLGPVQLKGKHQSIHIHECFNSDPAHNLEKKIRTLPVFNEGVSLYLNNIFSEAAISFQKVIDDNPDDHTAKIFLSNAQSYIESSISK